MIAEKPAYGATAELTFTNNKTHTYYSALSCSLIRYKCNLYNWNFYHVYKHITQDLWTILPSTSGNLLDTALSTLKSFNPDLYIDKMTQLELDYILKNSPTDYNKAMRKLSFFPTQHYLDSKIVSAMKRLKPDKTLLVIYAIPKIYYYAEVPTDIAKLTISNHEFKAIGIRKT